MSTYTQILYQIVFSTKDRHLTMIESGQERLYRFIWGILQKKKCHVYRINGVEDHIHLIIHLHPSVALADLVKDVKLATSDLIRDQKIFPHFTGWQDGYGGFTYSILVKDKLIEYVKNQKEHHKRVSFREEYISLLKEHEIDFDENYLF